MNENNENENLNNEQNQATTETNNMETNNNTNNANIVNEGEQGNTNTPNAENQNNNATNNATNDATNDATNNVQESSKVNAESQTQANNTQNVGENVTFVKTELSEEEKLKKKKRTRNIIIIVSISVAVLLVLIIGGIWLSTSLFNKIKDKNNFKIENVIENVIEEGKEGILTPTEIENNLFNNERLSRYNVVTNFTEDNLAWISGTTNSNENYYICINREGQEILRYKKYNYSTAPDGIREVTAFHNGLAIITNGENKKSVINTAGTVIVAEGDDKCTNIISEDTTFGYIIVEKIDDTYLGTTTMYGIVDSEGNFKVPLSEENEYLKNLGSSAIAKGIYTSGDKIYNIETGKEVERTSSFENHANYYDGKIFCYYEGSLVSDPLTIFSANDLSVIAKSEFELNEGLGGKVGEFSEGKIFIEYPDNNSDNGRVRGFFNEKLEKLIDLSELEITNEPIFIDGYANLVIRERWYTVIDEEGKMLFEPVEGVETCVNLGNRRFYVETEDGECKIIDENNNTIVADVPEMDYYTKGYYVSEDTERFIDTNGKELEITLKQN